MAIGERSPIKALRALVADRPREAQTQRMGPQTAPRETQTFDVESAASRHASQTAGRRRQTNSRSRRPRDASRRPPRARPQTSGVSPQTLEAKPQTSPAESQTARRAPPLSLDRCRVG